MPKVPLSTITSGYGTVDALNANFDAIEAAFDNTLSRDGDTPNQMSANLDMNGFSILNQGNPITVEGFNWEGQWLTATDYQVGDVVQQAGSAYICVVAHTSGVFATDLSALKWQLVVESSTLMISVKDFGAVGDGITNDTAAIQAALDEAMAIGGTVYVPAGVYAVTGLTYTNPFKMAGDTNFTSQLLLTNTTGNLFSASPTCAIMAGSSITDIWLKGAGRTVGTSTGWRGRLNGSNRHVSFVRVRATDFSLDAFNIPDSFNMSWKDCYILNNGNNSSSTGGGIKFEENNFGDVSTTGNIIDNCYISYNRYGVYCDDLVANQILGLKMLKVIFEGNQYGFRAIRSSTTCMDSCYFEAQTIKAVSCSGITMLDCHRYPPTSSTTDGLDITGSLVEVARSSTGWQYAGTDIVRFQTSDVAQYVEEFVTNSGAIRIGVSGNSRLYSQNGSPEGAVTAAVGSLCLNRSATGIGDALFMKVSGTGNTGWQSLSSIAPLSGTTAQRPAASASSRGTPFYNADNFQVEWSNGVSVWRQYNGLTAVRGTLASIPSAEVEGARYYATDADKLFINNGSTWYSMWHQPVFFVASSGGTTSVSARGGVFQNTASTTTATYTVSLPSGTNAVTGDRVVFGTRGAITTLSVTSSATVLDAPITLAANTSFEYMYDGSTTTWYRVR